MIYTESLRYSIGPDRIYRVHFNAPFTLSESIICRLLWLALCDDPFSRCISFFFFSKNSRSSRDSRIKRSAFLFSFFFGNVSIRNLNFGHVEKFNQLMSLTEIRRTDYVIIYSISIYIHANSLTNKEPKVIYFVYEFFTSRNEKKKITSRPSSLFIPLLPFSKTSKTIK